MAERYKKLFSLPSNQYASELPVIVSAGALLLDTKVAKTMAQLKFLNIDNRPIKSLTVTISELGADGNSLGDEITFVYSGLNVARDSEFGAQTPIMLEHTNASRISVTVKNVEFADGSTYETKVSEYESIPELTKINKYLSDEALAEYNNTYGNTAKFLAIKHADLWRCTCGRYNHSSEENCHACRGSLANVENVDAAELKNEYLYKKATLLMSDITKENSDEIIAGYKLYFGINIKSTKDILNRKKTKKLKELADYNDRMQAAINIFTSISDYKDSAENIKLCEEKIAKEKKRRRRKKAKTITIISLILAAIIFLLVLTNVIIPSNQLSDANALYSSGDYASAAESAYKSYSTTGSDDSRELLDKICAEVDSLIGEGKYPEAYAIAVKLSDYNYKLYNKADLLNNGSFGEAVKKYEMKTVILPASLTEIKDDMLEDCTTLEVIVISSGVSKIGNGAFARCTSLKSIVIPDTVTSIGDRAFSGCTALTSVTIPDSVTSIGSSAFSNCKSLAEIDIPTSVKSIGGSAFAGCTALSSIVLPDGITKIESNTFYDCSSLKSVTIPASVSEIAGDSSYYSSRGAFSNCTALETIIIPSGVKTIGDAVFSGCSALKSITIADTVTSIGEDAFYECTALESIIIPGGVKSVSQYTFYGCTSLKSAVLQSGVEVIGANAFEGCTSLEEVILPAGLNTIDYRVFEDCSSLVNIVLPDGLKTIESYAFQGCTALEGVILPEGITVIEGSTFSGCKQLKTVIISSTVKTIEENAFNNCTALEKIIIPTTVTTIEKYAFKNCMNLKIYARASSRPYGWEIGWDYSSSNNSVTWGYTGE